MKSILKSIVKYLFLFIIGGCTYYGMEVSYRGYSHWTMMILGGLCFILVGLINNLFTFNMYIEVQAVLGAVIITTLEFVTGEIVNKWLGWGIWDYSDLPFNIDGQVSLEFSFLWLFLSAIIIKIDDWIRYKYFGEEYPKYKSIIFDVFLKD